MSGATQEDRIKKKDRKLDKSSPGWYAGSPDPHKKKRDEAKVKKKTKKKNCAFELNFVECAFQSESR